MWGRRLVSVVEIDIDQCTLTWGQGACTAALGPNGVRKCYNTFGTCAIKQVYDKGTLTLRFCTEGNIPKGGNYIPALTSVGGYQQEVNINGFAETAVGIGKRASISFSFSDFPTNDFLTDKYWLGRIDGTAQTNEPGYDPMDRGSFWTKFKARNPNYAGRILRHKEGYIGPAGEFVEEFSREYVMDEITGPSNGGGVRITAKDILSLADNKKALAPKTSQGYLNADMTIDATTLTMLPVGIGDLSYPASGVAVIGQEIMSFTRSGDVLTVVRGQKGTVAATHAVNDTVQVCYDVFRVRADTVIRDLLVNYGNIPPAYIDWAGWQAEFNDWGSRYVLTATICKATEVTKLISEIARLGISIWWDPNAQLVKLKINHPLIDEPYAEWSDRNTFTNITQEDNDDERITRVVINSVQRDPTKEMNADNFLRSRVEVYVDGELPQFYGLPRTETINTRWMNHGDDTFTWILTARLLARYRRAPVTYTAVIDNKDLPDLTDVVGVVSHVATDITGLPGLKLCQVYSVKDKTLGVTTEVKLQEFLFTDRYGKFAPNDWPDYNDATDAQKSHGTWFAGPSLKFDDGTDAYVFA